MSLRDEINFRYKYAEHRWRALWAWAKRPDRKAKRHERWAALAGWTYDRHEKHQKARALGRAAEWWDKHVIYRTRKHRTAPAKQPSRWLSGRGPYEGTQSIIENEVLPYHRKHGIQTTSLKREETYGNPASDHFEGNLDAYAADGGVANAYWLSQEIARGMGIRGTVYDYRAYYIPRNGRRYRVQLIASTHGTGPHHHTGAKHE